MKAKAWNFATGTLKLLSLEKLEHGDSQSWIQLEAVHQLSISRNNAVKQITTTTSDLQQ